MADPVEDYLHLVASVDRSRKIVPFV